MCRVIDSLNEIFQKVQIEEELEIELFVNSLNGLNKEEKVITSVDGLF